MSAYLCKTAFLKPFSSMAFYVSIKFVRYLAMLRRYRHTDRPTDRNTFCYFIIRISLSVSTERSRFKLNRYGSPLRCCFSYVLGRFITNWDGYYFFFFFFVGRVEDFLERSNQQGAEGGGGYTQSLPYNSNFKILP